MGANDSFHIAVIPGDGIGPEVMAPALAVLERVAASIPGLGLRFSEAPAGAGHYRDTGSSMPEITLRLCEEADAILLGACGLPEVRYPDNTEIMPQVELRFIFDLYAGVRPCRLIPDGREPDRRRRRTRHRSGADPRIDRRPVRLHGQGRGDRQRGARDARDHAPAPASVCSSSRSVSPSGARRAGGPAGSPASTRPTHSRPMRSSGRCSTTAPAAIPRSPPSGSMSMPAPRCW